MFRYTLAKYTAQHIYLDSEIWSGPGNLGFPLDILGISEQNYGRNCTNVHALNFISEYGV